MKIVVIENEVGQESVDDKLVENRNVSDAADEVILMPNGCMCCRVRGDLIDTFKRVIGKAGSGLDGMVLELSGLSNLAPVVQTFFSDPYVQSKLKLDSVVCVVDATQVHRWISSPEQDIHAQLIREQLSLADVAIVNKVDCLSIREDEEYLKREVLGVNPTCKVYPCSLGGDNCSPLPDPVRESFLQANAFSLASAAQITDEVLTVKSGKHGHDLLGFSTVSIVDDSSPIDCEQLYSWLEQSIVKSFPEALVRYKGIIWSKIGGQDVLIVMQGVYGQIDFVRYRTITTVEQRKTVLVFIGPLKNKAYGSLENRLRKGVLNCRIETEQDDATEKNVFASKVDKLRTMKHWHLQE